MPSTPVVRELLVRAEDEVRGRESAEVGTGELLRAMLDAPDSGVAGILARTGLAPGRVYAAVDDAVRRGECDVEVPGVTVTVIHTAKAAATSSTCPEVLRHRLSSRTVSLTWSSIGRCAGGLTAACAIWRRVVGYLSLRASMRLLTRGNRG